jgi:hypothetical protein
VGNWDREALNYWYGRSVGRVPGLWAGQDLLTATMLPRRDLIMQALLGHWRSPAYAKQLPDFSSPFLLLVFYQVTQPLGCKNHRMLLLPQKETLMDVVFTHCAGLDVHKKKQIPRSLRRNPLPVECINRSLLMRHEHLTCALGELRQSGTTPSGSDRILPHPPEAFDGIEVMATMGR